MSFTIDATTYRTPNRNNREKAISAIIIHHGGGTAASDLAWLCNPSSRVSSNYYIKRDGTIYQLADDDQVTWHAGKARLDDDTDINGVSLGVEMEHTVDYKLARQGIQLHTDWTPIQLGALAWLIRKKVAEYGIPERRIATHRAVALPVGRKSDPAHHPMAPESVFRDWVRIALIEPTVETRVYTEDSPILNTTVLTLEQARKRFRRVSHRYSEADVNTVILPAYEILCRKLGVDFAVAVAQMAHETGWLTSWWSDRPRRNPAGIGVTGRVTRVQPADPRGWVKVEEGHTFWREGVSFPEWGRWAVPAHVGRLLAYALPVRGGTQEQQILITQALAIRSLPVAVRGSAQTIKQLGKVHNPSGNGWADPGDEYGRKIAEIANYLMS